MIAQQALDALGRHLQEGLDKHPPFADRGAAIQCITDRLTRLSEAHNAGPINGRHAAFERRLGQLAAICVKAMIQLQPDPTPQATE